MFIGTLLVKTRLPFAAWALAGLVTIFSLANSLMHISASSEQAAKPIHAHYAAVTDMLNFVGAF